jgi:hypothetical protein
MHPFTTDLQSVLDSDQAYAFLPTETWMEGGCTLLAMALQRLVPSGELYSVGRLDQGIPDHTILKVMVEGEAVYLDYDGPQSESELLDKVFDEWRFQNPSLAPADLDHLEELGMMSLTDAAPELANLIRSEIGPVDEDRLNPEWGEPEPQNQALS